MISYNGQDNGFDQTVDIATDNMCNINDTGRSWGGFVEPICSMVDYVTIKYAQSGNQSVKEIFLSGIRFLYCNTYAGQVLKNECVITVYANNK